MIALQCSGVLDPSNNTPTKSQQTYHLLTLGIVCAMIALQCSVVLDPSNNTPYVLFPIKNHLFLYFTVMDL